MAGLAQAAISADLNAVWASACGRLGRIGIDTGEVRIDSIEVEKCREQKVGFEHRRNFLGLVILKSNI